MTLTSPEAMELLWFYLLLCYLTLSDSVKNPESCLLQPEKTIWRKVGNNVILPCTVNTKCPSQPWRYEWFLFKENSHIRLNLTNHPNKYKLDGASLHIISLQKNDSGIYHCAAALKEEPGQGTQHVGPGMTLVVKEKMKTMVTNIYLWVVFALLLIYSLALVTLIVKKLGCRKIRRINQHNSTKKMHFRDVLQEMHRKKLRERGKAASSNSPQTEADDIYQNVKERFEVAN